MANRPFEASQTKVGKRVDILDILDAGRPSTSTMSTMSRVHPILVQQNLLNPSLEGERGNHA